MIQAHDFLLTPKLIIEEKVELVRQCINGEISIRGAAQKARVAPKSVRRWIIAYESEGASAFLPHSQNRLYSSELKKNAVQNYLSGQGSLEDICKKYKIRNPCILEVWIRVYNGSRSFRKNCVYYNTGTKSAMLENQESRPPDRA